MDVLKAIQTRREITSFKNTPVPNDILESILDAGYLAPTGNNLPSRELILVTNREKIDTLEKTTPYMKWLNEASAAVVITGRPDVSKYWIQDGSISSSFMWLRATELEVGVGFGAVYNFEDEKESFKREQWVRSSLNIPEDRRILAIFGIGYPENKPKDKKLPSREEIIYYESFK
ncbi:nitroreductase family protein [Neobacillus cucumis]|uniref:nitroreductase family protein n=1 Tax=Neobacillus cucumis TaxID=1740721 RepID=UPI0028534461|nr:nitroreductase family protein [Neobacillus cucumis]MDR4947100.1 nitroreductase family protein [Neobacillus cucumis]